MYGCVCVEAPGTGSFNGIQGELDRALQETGLLQTLEDMGVCYVVKACSTSPHECVCERVCVQEKVCDRTDSIMQAEGRGATFLHRARISSFCCVYQCVWCLNLCLCILYRGITVRVKSQSLRV